MPKRLSINKDELIKGRAGFFDAIINILFMPPNEVDVIMNQAHVYQAPVEDTLFSSPEQGVLQIHVKPFFFNKETHYCYTFFQFGDFLKLSVIIYGKEIESAPMMDLQQEINKLWPNIFVEPVWRGETLVYEWTFDLGDEDFYRDYEIQERFILGTRNMHFRLLSIFHDTMDENTRINGRI